MTKLFQKNFLQLLAIGCLCLSLLTVGISQDSSSATDAIESTTETTMEENAQSTEDVSTTDESTEETNLETATDSEASENSETPTSEEANDTETSSNESEANLEEVDSSSDATSEETTETEEATTSTETTETSATNESDDITTEGTSSEETGSDVNSDNVNTESESDSTEASEDTTSETTENTDTEITEEEQPSEENTQEEAVEEETSENTEADNSDNSNERVITVEYSGGNRKAVDFRYGPWIYSHPDEEGIIGTVGTDENEDSQLFIYAQEAELKAPEDVLIATAGERIATFTGGVRVERKRLTALGEALEYSEETGFGELSAEERIEITVLPKENDGELTEIEADAATFNVDTDVSVSRGGVTLENGSQSAVAEEITFEQGLDLAVITSPEGQVTVTRSNEDGDLIITADTIRVLTENKKLMASGDVTLVDGAITTTGQVVFFDDEIERAEVFGTPDNVAVSIDSEFDVTIKGERLEQRIDLDLVEILDETVPDIWDEVDFLLSSEANSE